MRRTNRYHPDNAVPFEHDVSAPWVQRDGTRSHVDILMQGVVDDSPELVGIVQEAMGMALTPLERAVVECSVDGGMSLSQIAAALGLKAKSYVHRVKIRAFAKLREHLINHPTIQERYGLRQSEGDGSGELPDTRP